jgi:hypothetical protein
MTLPNFRENKNQRNCHSVPVYFHSTGGKLMHSHNRSHHLIGWLFILPLLSLGIFLLFNTPQPTLIVGETGEAQKTGSGISLARQLTIAHEPSALPGGFNAERLWSSYDDWEPAIAAAPNSAYVYQMTTRYDGPEPCHNCGQPALIFRSSSNGGNTWNADTFLFETSKTQNDPMVEVATNGTVFVAWLNEYRPGVRFMKSTDHGQSWSEPINFTGGHTIPRWSDRPVLAISPDGQHVYVAFNASDSYVVASHDFGQTFSAPVRTNSDGRYWFHSAGAVAPNGDVYFAAVDYSQDYTGEANINLLKSTNGGTSWTTVYVDTSAEMPDCLWAAGCYFGFLGPSAALAVDGNGRIMLAYNAGNNPGQPQRLFARYSTDGGISWSGRERISGTELQHNGFPALAAGAKAGDFRLVWQGSYDGRNDAWNTWYRRTTNGGNSWASPIRLSNETNGAPYKHADGYNFPYGDYLEITVDGNGVNHIIWGEGTSYDGPGGTWYTKGN